MAFAAFLWCLTGEIATCPHKVAKTRCSGAPRWPNLEPQRHFQGPGHVRGSGGPEGGLGSRIGICRARHGVRWAAIFELSCRRERHFPLLGNLQFPEPCPRRSWKSRSHRGHSAVLGMYIILRVFAVRLGLRGVPHGRNAHFTSTAQGRYRPFLVIWKGSPRCTGSALKPGRELQSPSGWCILRAL